MFCESEMIRDVGLPRFRHHFVIIMLYERDKWRPTGAGRFWFVSKSVHTFLSRGEAGGGGREDPTGGIGRVPCRAT